MPNLLTKYICLLLALCGCIGAYCQSADNEKWASLFHQSFDGTYKATEALWDSISKKPLAEINNIIAALDNDKSTSETEEDRVKMMLLKLRYCRISNGYYNNTSWRSPAADALLMATVMEDDYLLQSCCNLLGDIYLREGKSDTAVFYMVKAIGLAEQLGYKKAVIMNDKIAASNALYHLQNYTECISFCRGDADMENTLLPIAVIAAYNNTGLCYLKLSRYDSALYYFNKAYYYCRRIKWGIWEGIVSGNIGDVQHAMGRDEAAMPYWQKDYDSCMQYGELQNAGLTLAFMSRYQFGNGQQQKAINQLHWAEAINRTDAGNLMRIYSIKADCYKKLGLHDSAWYFLQQHYLLADSISRVVSSNNFNTVQLKLAFEKNAHDYSILKKEKQAELVRRNLLLLALIALLLIGVLLYNRQRLKVKLARQQQSIAENETASAKEQLHIFTQTLLEKNDQIEKLTASLEQQQTANTDELIHQTLLTDYDWKRFKELFEKIHPQFFTHLKNIAPGVTQSEMRLAALIKLNLDNKQMASMQGISVSSLRGNKTRLRQKLNIAPETDLDELIKQL